MAETPPTPPDTAPSPEAGTIQWYDEAKRIGLVARAGGSTLFIPPYRLAEGQRVLGVDQPITFVVRGSARRAVCRA